MWQLKVYKISEIALRRFCEALQVLFRGFWLGVLSSDALHKLDELYYDNTEKYCSLDYNKRGLQKWERQMLESFFQNRRSLILIAAGGGREVFALQQMGFAVDAFECNEKLLDFGNKLLAAEGLKPCINFLERDQCPSHNKKYEGAIFGWGGYMLIQGRERRIEFLRKMRGQLQENSPLLLSFYSRGGEGITLKGTVLIANALRFVLRRERLQIGDDIVPTYVHYFTQAEVFAELEAAGFAPQYYSSQGYGHAVGIVN